MTEPVHPLDKADARLRDLSRKSGATRKAIAAYKQARLKNTAVDAPIDPAVIDDLHTRLSDMQSTVQLLLYNLERHQQDTKTRNDS